MLEKVQGFAKAVYHKKITVDIAIANVAILFLETMPVIAAINHSAASIG